MNESAQVVLLRPAPSGFEVFLLKRTGDAYALPGGGVHDGEDPRVAAARVLFEDAGVILARDAGQAETLEMFTFATMRKKIRGGAHATEVLRSAGLTWSAEVLMPWSHWVTPSIYSALRPSAELRTPAQPGLASDVVRSSTRIFVAEQPAGMAPTFDKTESVTQMWLRPSDAPRMSGELALSPALVRTCWELSQYQTIKQVLAAARTRAEEPHPILPRLAARGSSMVLLLPWDPEYETAGQGESHPFAYQPAWATGASRFVLEDRTWKHVSAPGSTTAG